MSKVAHPQNRSSLRTPSRRKFVAGTAVMAGAVLATVRAHGRNRQEDSRNEEPTVAPITAAYLDQLADELEETARKLAARAAQLRRRAQRMREGARAAEEAGAARSLVRQ